MADVDMQREAIQGEILTAMSTQIGRGTGYEGSVRILAEAYALLAGTFTGDSKVNVKS